MFVCWLKLYFENLTARAATKRWSRWFFGSTFAGFELQRSRDEHQQYSSPSLRTVVIYIQYSIFNAGGQYLRQQSSSQCQFLSHLAKWHRSWRRSRTKHPRYTVSGPGLSFKVNIKVFPSRSR